MKLKQRLLSLLLVICLVAGLLPTTVFAAGTGDKNIMLGTSQIEGGQASSVYFGNYYQSDASGQTKDPIKWRVLSNADGELFLLSDQNLDVKQYNSSNIRITWEKSTIRSWLNGYGANENNVGTDYNSDNFIGTAFSSEEQGAIAETYVYNATQSDEKSNPNPTYISIPGGNNTTDKIFLLSIEEANNSSYFPNGDSSRISTNTAYVAGHNGVYGVGAADYWWLRSPGGYVVNAAYVRVSGGVHDHGYSVDTTDSAVRPAFNLNLNSVLFTSAAEGGKISAAASGGNQGGEAADAIFEIGDYAGNEWKLTLLDASRNNFSISGATTNDGAISFSYSGAQTGTNEYISVVVVDNGAITHYGRILQLDGTTNSASGTASLSLPAGVTLSGNTKLYVFNEQYNGGEKDDTKLTDYASQLIEVDITAPTLTGGNATRESETNATVKFTSDEAGTYYYAVVDNGTPAPSDLTASGTSGSCVKGENTINLTSLTAGAKDIYIVVEDAAGNVSETLKIEIPASALSAPTNLAWDSNTPSKATWGAVDNASGYSVQLYKDGTAHGTAVSTTGTDHTFTITEAGGYTFKVKATSSADTYTDSDEAESGKLFTVSFDTNGAGTVNMQLVTDGGKVTEPTAPTKTGYTFKGWYSNSGFSDSNKWDFSSDTVSQAMTLYAKWLSTDAGVTAVSVNKTEGEINGDTINVVLPFGTSSLPTDSNAVTIIPAAGATFSNLTLAENNGSRWTFTVTAEDGTTTADYTINVSIAPDPATGNKADVAAAKSTIEAHDSWTVEQAIANTEAAVKSWIESVLQSMNLNDVTCTVSITGFTPATAGNSADQNGTNGSFTFAVSLSKGADDTLATDTTAGINGTITATPYQAQSYAVSVSASPAEGGTVSGGGTYTENTSVAVTASANNGYHFVKWTEGGGEINTSAAYTFTVTGNRTLVAVFEQDSTPPPTEYTVTFDAQGGSVTPATMKTVGGKLPSLPVPSRSSYTFKGWFTQASGGAEITTDSTFTADASVYAHWTYNGGGIYIPPSTPTYPPTVEKPSGGGGTPSVSPSNPRQGDTVTVTPKPDDGHEVGKITVTDRNGKPVEVTKKPDGTYTFKQPSGKVTVKVTYQPIDRPWNNPFTDVSEGDWYYEAVRFVQERGLMNGYSDGRFGPNDPLSRAQLAQILFNKEGRPGVNYLLTFSDVAGEAWYTEAIRWATSQGIVGGYGNGMFGPNDPITREQLAVMLWRYSGSPAATNKELHFADADEISPFALEAMRWAVENGILGGYGDGRLGPQGQATRAQVAQMLKNFIENQEENT